MPITEHNMRHHSTDERIFEIRTYTLINYALLCVRAFTRLVNRPRRRHYNIIVVSDRSGPGKLPETSSSRADLQFPRRVLYSSIKYEKSSSPIDARAALIVVQYSARFTMNYNTIYSIIRMYIIIKYLTHVTRKTRKSVRGM